MARRVVLQLCSKKLWLLSLCKWAARWLLSIKFTVWGLVRIVRGVMKKGYIKVRMILACAGFMLLGGMHATLDTWYCRSKIARLSL